MADMSITAFKARIAGRAARPNLFEVVPAWPVVISAGLNGLGSEFRFLCKAAQIPPGTVGELDIPFRGRHLYVPSGDRTYEAWTITILNDTDYTYRRAFENWHRLINDPRTNLRQVDIPNLLTDWTVYQLNGRGQRVQGYRLVDSWPQAIGGIDLNNDTDNTIEEFTVSIRYQYWEHIDITNALSGILNAASTIDALAGDAGISL